MIFFSQNTYLSILKQNPQFCHEHKILHYAKRSPQFFYGDVSYQEFAKNYSPKGWAGRKIMALPAAVWSGTVKVIYHIAKGILWGIPKLVFSRDIRFLKAQCFHIARDGQEAFGRLVSLFNDRYGLYHTQSSTFHKTCYDCFAFNDFAKLSPSQQYRPFSDKQQKEEAQKISLEVYRQKGKEEREELQQKLALPLDHFKRNLGISFDQFIDQADTESSERINS